jgi:hypothetical protein
MAGGSYGGYASGWLDWYVKDLQPLEGPMPPLDISDRYGLDFSVEEGISESAVN